MSYTPTTTRQRRPVMALILLTIGTGGAIANLGSLFVHLFTILTGIDGSSSGYFSDLGISVLHSMQAVAFNTAAVSSVGTDILILSAAVVLAMLGMGLLQRVPLARQPQVSPVSSKGSR